MRKNSDAQRFDELATQLEELADAQKGRADIDADLANEVLAKLTTLKKAPRNMNKDILGPDHLREIDESLGFKHDDEIARKEAYESHIAAIDNAIQGEYNNGALIDAALFLRGIIVGIEKYMIALDRARR